MPAVSSLASSVPSIARRLSDVGIVVKPLDASTWDAFARLVDRHNGVSGGCWCTWFHTFHREKTFTADGNRALKERLVAEGGAHASLVFDADEAIAWAQYGSPEELPNIHQKGYEETRPASRLPDPGIFDHKEYRRLRVPASPFAVIVPDAQELRRHLLRSDGRRRQPLPCRAGQRERNGCHERAIPSSCPCPIMRLSSRWRTPWSGLRRSSS